MFEHYDTNLNIWSTRYTSSFKEPSYPLPLPCVIGGCYTIGTVWVMRRTDKRGVNLPQMANIWNRGPIIGYCKKV